MATYSKTREPVPYVLLNYSTEEVTPEIRESLIPLTENLVGGEHRYRRVVVHPSPDFACPPIMFGRQSGDQVHYIVNHPTFSRKQLSFRLHVQTGGNLVVMLKNESDRFFYIYNERGTERKVFNAGDEMVVTRNMVIGFRGVPLYLKVAEIVAEIGERDVREECFTVAIQEVAKRLKPAKLATQAMDL